MKTSFIAASLAAASSATLVSQTPYQVDPSMVNDISNVVDVPDIKDIDILPFPYPLPGSDGCPPNMRFSYEIC